MLLRRNEREEVSIVCYVNTAKILIPTEFLMLICQLRTKEKERQESGFTAGSAAVYE